MNKETDSPEQQILDQKILDQKILDQKILDQKILDQKILDQKILDQKILDQKIHYLENILKNNAHINMSLADKLKENPKVEKIISINASRYSGWNYRILRKYSEEDGMYYDQIHEVYYDHANRVADVALNGDTVYGDVLPNGVSEIFQSLQDMVEACKYPILDYDTYEEIDVTDPKYQISEDERDIAFNKYIVKIKSRWGSGAHGDE